VTYSNERGAGPRFLNITEHKLRPPQSALPISTGGAPALGANTGNPPKKRDKESGEWHSELWERALRKDMDNWPGSQPPHRMMRWEIFMLW
jgi:hypothetical protein